MRCGNGACVAAEAATAEALALPAKVGKASGHPLWVPFCCPSCTLLGMSHYN